MTVKVESLERLEARAREIGETLRSAMPPGVGFALFMFDVGEDGWMTYMSTARREDLLEALREFIAREERRS